VKERSPIEADQSNYTSNVSKCDPNDEMAVLKRQLRALTRRITAIEIEQQHRQQREVVLYTIGVLYLVIKGAFWLNRHW